MRSISILLTAAGLLVSQVQAQLSGRVGPLTSVAKKAAVKTCNVLKYGAKADGTTDLGPPLLSAFLSCKSGGLVVVPEGDYAMSTWVTLSGGNAWALQLDGVISRVGTGGGNMIFIEHGDDFEMFSSTGKGAMQGNGYIFHREDNYSGPRLLRTYEMSNFAIHDISLVDSPSFHLVVTSSSNGEVYNMAIRGGNHGGLDGIDVWSDNMHIHDVMVTNKDECVTVKSPASNILIENVYCNWSGGCSFGSLGSGTNISNIVYRNVYTTNSNQMLMIKTNGGSGTVSNVLLENFLGHANAYQLTIDQYWADRAPSPGPGVQLEDITFKDWTGHAAAADERPGISLVCAAGAPCAGLDLRGVNLVDSAGAQLVQYCQYAHGGGAACFEADGAPGAGATTTVAAPAGLETGVYMAQDLTADFGTADKIPLPTIGPSFFPGVAPLSRIAGSSTSSAVVCG